MICQKVAGVDLCFVVVVIGFNFFFVRSDEEEAEIGIPTVETSITNYY